MADVKLKAAAGEEFAVLMALAMQHAPGTNIIYHTGWAGTCPSNLKEAAREIAGAGRVLLFQRPAGPLISGRERKWHYIAQVRDRHKHGRQPKW